MAIEIPLTQGKVALIDPEDFTRVNQFEWHAARRDQTWYAASSALRRRNGACLYMHRLILNASLGQHVDHRNGDGLDCRRENLRLCTNAENRRNMRKTRGGSRFKGVCRCRDNATRIWEAYIWFENKKIPLGNYETEEEAARAYNAAAVVYHKDFANLNPIPGLTYEESLIAPIRNRKCGRPAKAPRINSCCDAGPLRRACDSRYQPGGPDGSG